MQASGPWPPVMCAERVEHVDVFVVQRFRSALRRRQREPFGEAIDRDDALGAEQVRALDRELTDRAAAPDGDRVARLDLAVVGRHVAGREDVREKEDLLVGQRVRHLQRPDVGKRHARVFRLAAGIAAVHVRVAEQTRRGIAVQLLGHPGIRIRVVAQRPELLLAEVAAAAGDGERHDDAIADLEPRVVFADLDDFAHELVAEDVALLHRRDVAVVDVQVGSADRRRRDLDDGVARIEDRPDRERSRRGSSSLPSQQTARITGSYAVAVARGISPASSSCLKCRRSSRTVCDGSRPKSDATSAPAFPAGGAYCRCTLTWVLRPPRTASKFTDPAVTTSEPGSDRHARTLFSTSLMISASHSTASPPGPAATQCDLPSAVVRHPVEVRHELRQIVEATPEAVDVGDRHFQANRLPNMNAALAAEGRTCGVGLCVAVE